MTGSELDPKQVKNGAPNAYNPFARASEHTPCTITSTLAADQAPWQGANLWTQPGANLWTQPAARASIKIVTAGILLL